jgi:hypothetical protein
MKLINSIKICCLLVLGFCVMSPVYAPWPPGDSDAKKPDQEKKDSPDNKPSSNQQSYKNTEQDEAAAKNLFKDATYEKFEHPDNAEREIFDKDYLEPRQ